MKLLSFSRALVDVLVFPILLNSKVIKGYCGLSSIISASWLYPVDVLLNLLGAHYTVPSSLFLGYKVFLFILLAVSYRCKVNAILKQCYSSY